MENTPSGNSHTILIADDDRVAQQTLETLLTGIGYRVLVAHNGEEARDRIREFRPDLCVLDID
ncbi:MAG TPA: response regulator, partial [Elusimicrobiota bacterium]|nr:response regulator [Elusimicrobiota bacterium]